MCGVLIGRVIDFIRVVLLLEDEVYLVAFLRGLLVTCLLCFRAELASVVVRAAIGLNLHDWPLSHALLQLCRAMVKHLLSQLEQVWVVSSYIWACNGCEALLLHDGVGVHVLDVGKQALNEFLVLHQEI